jgi:hypothetical protein
VSRPSPPSVLQQGKGILPMAALGQYIAGREVPLGARSGTSI